MQTHFHSLRLSRPVVIVVTTLLATLLLSAMSVSAQATDPLAVMKASLDAINAGNVEAASATFADDAVITILTGSFRGKEQIRRSQADNVANHFRVEVSNFQVAGDKVTYSFKQSDDRLRRLGIEFITGNSEAIIQGGKIKSLTGTPSPESAARVQAAVAAAQQQPQTLPKTGGESAPNIIWLAALGLSALICGLGLIAMRRARRM